MNRRRTPTRDDGFSLTELLVVIVVLGVLAGIVVFAMRGSTTGAQEAATATDAQVLRNAEEAYHAQYGRYASESELVVGGLVRSESELNDVVLGTDGDYQIIALGGNESADDAAPGTPTTATPTTATPTTATPTTATPTTATPTTATPTTATPTTATPTTATPTTATPTTATPTTVPLGGSAACPGTYAGVVGEYYANQNLTGAPAMCRDDAAVAFNWGTAGPGGGLPVFRFSARWTQHIVLNSGAHTFTLTSDDGSRLFVDGTLVIDWWSDHTFASKATTLTLAAGRHTIVVEYYQYYGGAQIALKWT